MYSSAPMVPLRPAVVAACLAGVVALTAGSAGAEIRCALAPDGTLHVVSVLVPPAAAEPATGVVARDERSGDDSPLDPFLPKAEPYVAEILAASSRHGLSPALLAAIISVESDFNPRAVSAKGAQGLMQVLPATGRLLGVADLFDVRQNVDAGARHLRGLLERFSDDLSLALAAYNAGEQAVLTHNGIPPFGETRQYVSRVLRLFRGEGETDGASSPPEAPAPPPQGLERLYRAVAGDGTVIYSNRARPSGSTPGAPEPAVVESEAVTAALDASASPEACRVARGRLE